GDPWLPSRTRHSPNGWAASRHAGHLSHLLCRNDEPQRAPVLFRRCLDEGGNPARDRGVAQIATALLPDVDWRGLDRLLHDAPNALRLLGTAAERRGACA